ncbi:MAG: YcgN family cysteine cluster protein [Pseudomonadota bacterium]
MTDPIPRAGLAPRFWETKRLAQMSQPEWEALCDGCGKCCLNKLEDEDSGEVALTRIACRLLDDATCRCAHYDNRHAFVPDCIVLTPDNLESHLYWIPQTCAYRLLHEGRPLYDWHPLISGTAETVHSAEVSMRGRTLSEYDVADEDWEDHIIDEPT